MASQRSHRSPIVSGVTVTHPDRLMFPDLGLTKLSVVRYYEAVTEWILPHLLARPLTLVQCAPDAAHCRYLRHSGARAPSEVRVVRVQEQTKIGDYMVVDDAAGLIALAQRNIIEFHTWNAPITHVERPDRIVLDLDPGPLVTWPQVIHAARLLRSVLRDIGLRSWVKSTGGRGLHVVVPIRPRYDWTTCLDFARSIATSLVEHDPARYTVKFAKRGRERQILIDYLRNNRTNTAVAAYSARSRPTASISVPLDWEELSARRRPETWTVKTAPRRLRDRTDPWKDYFTTQQRLPM